MKSHNIASYLYESHRISPTWPNLNGSFRISPNLIVYCHILLKLTKSHHISQNLTKSHQIYHRISHFMWDNNTGPAACSVGDFFKNPLYFSVRIFDDILNSNTSSVFSVTYRVTISVLHICCLLMRTASMTHHRTDGWKYTSV